MVSKNIILALKDGLHARPASEIIQHLKNYKSNVKMQYGERTANCKSIISLLALGAKANSEIEVIVEGENENEELASFVAFLKNLEKH